MFSSSSTCSSNKEISFYVNVYNNEKSFIFPIFSLSSCYYIMTKKKRLS